MPAERHRIFDSKREGADTRILIARTDYGFDRTICGCWNCTQPCRHMPGMLAPADVPRIAQRLDYDDVGVFARENLVASPGATVIHEGKVKTIPTLVPQRQANGHCKFLTDESQCAIHDVAPYGCSHFSYHMSRREGDRRSEAVLRDVMESHEKEEEYSLIWYYLHSLGLVGRRPVEARMQMEKELAARG